MSLDLNSFLEQLNHWHWGILAVVLVLIEIVAPVFFFLWLGVAAGIVGGLLFIFPEMGWKTEFLLFSAISLLSVGISRTLLLQRPTQTDQPTLNRRASQYVGRVFTLTDPIQDGVGRIQVGDTSWMIAGRDMPSGTKIKIVGFDGIILSADELEV